jgi:hypothetical protein
MRKVELSASAEKGSNPLDRFERFQVTSHSPFQDFACRMGSKANARLRRSERTAEDSSAPRMLTRHSIAISRSYEQDRPFLGHRPELKLLVIFEPHRQPQPERLALFSPAEPTYAVVRVMRSRLLR